MGRYYIVACDDCRVQSMLPKCTQEGAEKRHTIWTEKKHLDHKTVLGHDEDEYFEAKLDGRKVIEMTYFGLKTEPESEPYKEESFDESILD